MNTPRLSGWDLIGMRATADDSFPDTVEVWHPTLVSDMGGGTTRTWARTWAGPGRKAPFTTVASAEQVYADRLGGVQGWWFSIPYGAGPVYLQDQVRSAGLTFEVVAFDAGRSNHISQRILTRLLS